MKLSTKGRYAVTAMLDLALHSSEDLEKPVTLADIAVCQNISLSYLEQLFARLRKHNLVTGVRGPGGGYSLARDAALISIAEVIEAVDETVDVTRCQGKSDCRDGRRCLTHDLWMDLSQEISSFLSHISLADLVTRNKTREVRLALASSNLPAHKPESIVAASAFE